MYLHRRKLLGLLALGSLPALEPAFAQSAYPNKPITLVIPLPPGSDTDMVGRLLAEHMARTLKQPIVIDNRAGAGGQLGLQKVVTSPPDGYTLGLPFQATLALLPHLRKVPPYDPFKDFVPVARFATTGNAIAVKADSPIKTLADLISRAKASPGKLSYGSWGIGSGGHLFGEALKINAGIDMLHVPYKGTPEELTALLAGEIDVGVFGFGITSAQVRAGTIRAIAVPTSERSIDLPDAITFREAGIKFAMDGWFGVVAPAHTPPPIVATLQAAVIDAAKSPEIAQKLRGMAMKAAPADSEEFARIIRNDYDTTGRVVAAMGLEKS